MRAAIYCRVSTNEQVQLDALKIQIKEARLEVEQNGWTLAAEYVESESGTTAEGRREYLRMLSDMSEKKFDVLVIKSEDRLNRNVKDWYLLIDKMTQADVKLYFYLTRSFYQTDNSLITGLKAILAEEYSRQLSVKENNAHRYRQQHGTSVIITNNTYGLRKNEKKEVVIVEQEAQIIRIIYEMAREGYGARSISTYLFNQGITNRAGKQFNDSDIRRMVRNPLFTGVAVMNKTHYDFDKKKLIKNPKSEWIYHENMVPAIVDDELWKAANEMLDIHAKKSAVKRSRKKHTGSYNFSGKIKCACCQSVYYKTFRRRYAKKDELIVEWKCSSYLNYGRADKGAREQLRKVPKQFGKGCDNWHVQERILLEIMDHMALQLFDPKKDDNLFEQILRVLRQTLTQQEHEESLSGLTVMKENIEQRKSALLDKLLDGVVSDEQYKKKLEELNCQQQNIEKRYEDLMHRREELENKVSRVEQIKEKLKKGGMEEIKRRILMEMVDEILVKEDELVIRVQPGNLMNDPNADEIACKEFHFDRMTYFASATEKLDARKQELYNLIKEQPEMTNRQAADKLGVGFSSVRRWIKKYQEEGVMKYDSNAKKWIVK